MACPHPRPSNSPAASFGLDGDIKLVCPLLGSSILDLHNRSMRQHHYVTDRRIGTSPLRVILEDSPKNVGEPEVRWLLEVEGGASGDDEEILVSGDELRHTLGAFARVRVGEGNPFRRVYIAPRGTGCRRLCESASASPCTPPNNTGRRGNWSTSQASWLIHRDDGTTRICGEQLGFPDP